MTTHAERMTRALVHIGLAATLVLAPALCCCKVRGLGATARAAPARPLPAPTEPCHFQNTSCCQEVSKHAPRSQNPTDHNPPQPAPESCACYGERPDAAQTESKPTVSAAEPTGELLPLTIASVGSPEHLGLVRGCNPSDRTGVDARSAALFDRHVMRC